MSCEKCKDIHTAQLSGATQEPCRCGCHCTFYPTYPYTTFTSPLITCGIPNTTVSVTQSLSNT